MKNFDLNFGGLIGALLGLAVSGVAFYLLQQNNDDVRLTRRGGLVVLSPVFVGAAVGNWLWARLFPK